MVGMFYRAMGLQTDKLYVQGFKCVLCQILQGCMIKCYVLLTIKSISSISVDTGSNPYFAMLYLKVV